MKPLILGMLYYWVMELETVIYDFSNLGLRDIYFFFRSVVVNAIKRHFNDVLLPLMDVCVVSLCS